MYALQKPFTAPRAAAGSRASRRASPVLCQAQKPRLADAAAMAAAIATVAPAAQAAELFSSANVDSGSLTFALGAGGAIAGLGALLVVTDPQNRWESRKDPHGSWGDQKMATLQ